MSSLKCIVFLTSDGKIILHTHHSVSLDLTDNLRIWNISSCEHRPINHRCMVLVLGGISLFTLEHFHTDLAGKETKLYSVQVEDFEGFCISPEDTGLEQPFESLNL